MASPSTNSNRISLESNRISLEDYSTFQYMLARPAVAKAVVQQITSFVMYHEPYDEAKDHDKSKKHNVLVEGQSTFLNFNYYCCCIALLPSHLLGMSKWISAEDYFASSSSSSSSRTRNNSTDKEKAAHPQPQPGDTLRRFRYSYYCGFLQVDTRHICVEDCTNNTHNGKGDPENFFLVEYLDCPISPMTIFRGVFVLASWCVVNWLQSYGIVGGQFSSLIVPVTVLVVVVLQLILYLTGVGKFRSDA